MITERRACWGCAALAAHCQAQDKAHGRGSCRDAVFGQHTTDSTALDLAHRISTDIAA